MNQVKSNGASNTLFQHDRPNKPNRSRFDLSRLTNITADVGQIIPFDLIPTLPGDSFDLNIKFALDTLPLVQSSLTNYKVLFHWYYMKNRDLWKGWKTFITKGRSGNVDWLQIPRVNLSEKLQSPTTPYDWHNNNFKGTDPGHKNCKVDIFPLSKNSLSSFLGVPSNYDGIISVDENGDNPHLYKDYLPYTFRPNVTDPNKELTSSQLNSINKLSSTGFNPYYYPNALPFMMYQSIVKHNYVNQNLLQGNTALFPEMGDDDWILPSTFVHDYVNFVDGSMQLGVNDKVNYTGIYSSDETKVDLRLLRYAMFDDDYFTTGLPWLQRGDAQSLQFNLDMSEVDPSFSLTENDIQMYDSVFHSFPEEGFVNFGVGFDTENRSTSGLVNKIYDTDPDSESGYTPMTSSVRNNINRFLNHIRATYDTYTASSSLTANQLRTLIATSVWQERNARVDGSYNRMIFQHWALNPHSEEHLPTYIGGTAGYVNFSTIIQNSESTSNSPLGATAGYGSLQGSDNVNTFRCDDYGYIMGIMIIKPNTIYQQGVERCMSCENVFDDFIQPEFEGLSPQPILNKELYITGISSADDDMFCYQERNTSYKVRQNVNRGLFQVKPDKDILFGAFTQARWFESKPEFSYQFCVMSPDNIRRDWLAYPVYPAFRLQILSDVYATRNLSYTSEPNTFGF